MSDAAGSSEQMRLFERVDAFFAARRQGDAAATQIARMLFRLHHAMLRVRLDAGKAHGLTHAAMLSLIILRACYPDEPITPSQLREGAMLTSGGMTKVLHTLEERGLVERRPHASDARSTMLLLSEQGVALMETLLPQVNSMDQELFLEPLSASEAETLIRLLNKLNAAAYPG